MTTAQSLKIRKRFRSVLYQIIAICIGLLLVSPILYALVISFMPGEDILTIPPKFLPSRWITENYEMAWTLTTDRKSTRLNSSHKVQSRMPSSA